MILLQNSIAVPISTEIDIIDRYHGIRETELVLQDLGPSDNGTYRCAASNSYGVVVNETTVHVISTAENEKRHSYQSDVSLVLDCFSQVIFRVVCMYIRARTFYMGVSV